MGRHGHVRHPESRHAARGVPSDPLRLGRTARGDHDGRRTPRPEHLHRRDPRRPRRGDPTPPKLQLGPKADDTSTLRASRVVTCRTGALARRAGVRRRAAGGGIRRQRAGAACCVARQGGRRRSRRSIPPPPHARHRRRDVLPTVARTHHGSRTFVRSGSSARRGASPTTTCSAPRSGERPAGASGQQVGVDGAHAVRSSRGTP